MSSNPRPWPQNDLQAVPQCPACNGTERSLLHKGLSDRVFGVADGLWGLYRFAQCASGYLDLRPTPDSVGRAYASYYTHNAEDHPIVRRKGRLRSLLHALLKSGGVLWLDTPNVSSLGAMRCGPHWRGLKAPRHMVLFCPSSMHEALTAAGFHTFRQHWRGLSLFNVFAPSEALARGEPATTASHQGHPPLRDVLAELREMVQPSCREFITISARK